MLARRRHTFDPLAQSVEHLPFKQGVAGSIPARVTIQGAALCGSLSGVHRAVAGTQIERSATLCEDDEVLLHVAAEPLANLVAFPGTVVVRIAFDRFEDLLRGS